MKPRHVLKERAISSIEVNKSSQNSAIHFNANRKLV